MRALIDMDLVCFRSAASAEDDDCGIAIWRMNSLLDRLLDKVGATEYEAYLTGETNFRKVVYPEYKANRTAERPKHLPECRAYAMKQMGAVLAPNGLEADDSLGMNQTDDTIICSLDKDLLMIPGKHFQWAISGKNWKKEDMFLDQTYLEGVRLFYKQCIKGDASDNIKGIKGMGEARANKELDKVIDEQAMFNRVRYLYGNDEEFLMNARVLWIMRSIDDDYGDRFNALLQK
jgi:5'-3' exonuclease